VYRIQIFFFCYEDSIATVIDFWQAPVTASILSNTFKKKIFEFKQIFINMNLKKKVVHLNNTFRKFLIQIQNFTINLGLMWDTKVGAEMKIVPQPKCCGSIGCNTG
jgi:hypothetical protein